MSSRHNLGHELVEGARARRDNPVFIEYSGGRRAASCSGREFVALVGEIGRTLDRRGAAAGMRAALCLPNGTLYAAAFAALLTRGIVAAPLKLEYRAAELAAVFRDLQPHFVLSDPGVLPVLAPHLRRFKHIPSVLVVRGLQFEDASSEAVESALETVAEQLTPVGPAPEENPDLPNEAVSINFTYRGYGYPLGALLTAQQYRDGAAGVANGIEIERCRNVGLMLPMSHIYGLVTGVVLPLLYGVPTVVVTTAHPRRALETFAAERISFLPVVPELAEALYLFAPPDGSGIGVELLALGGSALSSEQFERFRGRIAPEVINGYGLTEFTPVAMHRRRAARAGTIGTPLPVLQTRCAASDGELLLRGEGVALGYYRRPTETGEAFDRDGWFHTGDICRYDGDELVFVREKKATCKANGLMVDLAELRAVFEACDFVDEAEIRLGDEGISATVIIGDASHNGAAGDKNETETETERELRRRLVRFLKPRIAGYKIPKVINVKSR